MDSNWNLSPNQFETPNPAVFIIRPPPPFPAPPRSVDLSALEFILGIIAVISIPAFIYTFFFAIKCPPDPFRRRRHHDALPPPSVASPPATASVKYSREIHGGECPVCLSAFGEGEDVKPLSACGHAFHVACVDTWLSSHPNCPVCRAIVPSAVKPTAATNSNQRSSRATNRHDDLHQGLPDASNLV